MGFLKTVYRHLIAHTAAFLHASAYILRQVEGIPHDGKGNAPFPEFFQQPPKIWMQDGISPGQVEVGPAVKGFAKILAVFQHSRHLLPRHAADTFLLAFGENITVLAALVAIIGDMPLK